jgi:hypothetical protein
LVLKDALEEEHEESNAKKKTPNWHVEPAKYVEIHCHNQKDCTNTEQVFFPWI